METVADPFAELEREIDWNSSVLAAQQDLLAQLEEGGGRTIAQKIEGLHQFANIHQEFIDMQQLFADLCCSPLGALLYETSAVLEELYAPHGTCEDDHDHKKSKSKKRKVRGALWFTVIFSTKRHHN